VLFAVVEACTGEDPPAVVPTDASTDPNASHAAPTDAGGRDFGIFLTSRRFATDFAVDASLQGLELVDSICTSAAAEAGLPNAKDYHALIAVTADVLDASAVQQDLARIVRFQTAGKEGDRWCTINGSGSAPHPDCAPLSVIFDGPEGFKRGPSHALLSDEKGKPVSYDTFARFLSGIRFDPEGPRIRNCSGWQNRAETVEADAGLRYEVGIGEVDPKYADPADSFGYKWAGTLASSTLCRADIELPFLCVEGSF
jgi:hypothetical protein